MATSVLAALDGAVRRVARDATCPGCREATSGMGWIAHQAVEAMMPSPTQDVLAALLAVNGHTMRIHNP